jgi:ribosomal protein S18 acetylase RimI-like enzyme
MTQDAWTLRLALQSDIAAVVRLTEAWAREGTTHGIIPSPTDHLIERLGRYFWVAVVDTAVVGFVHGTVHTSDGLAVIPAGERYLEIEDLYILPAYRNCGIGTALVETLWRAAEEDGVIRGLVHSATKDWERIVEFYRRFGYKMWYVQMYR